MTDRLENYHRPFDPNFNQLSFTAEDHRAIDALNLQTARKFRTRTHAQRPFPEDPASIDPQILAWRSTGLGTTQLDAQNILHIHEHPFDDAALHDSTPPNHRPVLKDHELPVLHQALSDAIERDALLKIEQLDPELGTQLRQLFYTTPSNKCLHFESVQDPPLSEDLESIPGHYIRFSSDNTLYIDWISVEAVLMQLSIDLSLRHIAHWDPTEDNPPETRRALVTWLWNGNHAQWTRTIRMIPPTCPP